MVDHGVYYKDLQISLVRVPHLLHMAPGAGPSAQSICMSANEWLFHTPPSLLINRISYLPSHNETKADRLTRFKITSIMLRIIRPIILIQGEIKLASQYSQIYKK